MTTSPNTNGEVTATQSAQDLDNEILDIMTAMTSQRNQNTESVNPVETGSQSEANDKDPVEEDSIAVEPEVAETSDEEEDEATDDDEAPEEVSDKDADSTDDDLIDFIELSNTNPDLKFKFMRNGKEMTIDARKAAAILGQGGAIHEEARELKVQKAEFDEYVKETRARQEGLTLAMEFTIQPKLQEAYDEIIKTQGYQQVFRQQLSQTSDYAEIARIEAAIAQNEHHIANQYATANQLKPAIEEFKNIRKQQVAEVIENSRKQFKDKELKNSFVFNELREKLSKGWEGARGQLVPGIDNIDLVSSDEHLLSLVRDGLKYRDRPKSKSSGSSIAALTTRKSTQSQTPSTTAYEKLREQAKRGNKQAQDDLILATINAQLSGQKKR
jgi:hypothetical protein